MKAINAYRRQSVTTADPYAIVVALYDGLIRNLHGASHAAKEADFGTAGEKYGKALAILSELEAAVDLRQSPEFGMQLVALYAWFQREILQANLKRQPERLDPILVMAGELRDAWETAARQLRSNNVA